MNPKTKLIILILVTNLGFILSTSPLILWAWNTFILNKRWDDTTVLVIFIIFGLGIVIQFIIHTFIGIKIGHEISSKLYSHNKPL